MLRTARLLFASLLLGFSCAARKPPPAAPAVVVQAAALGPTDRLAAIRSLEEALTDGVSAEDKPWVMLNAGEQRRLAGDNSVARAWFERVAAEYPTHPTKSAAILGMALVDADSSLSGNIAATLQLMGDVGVPDSMNGDRYRLLARIAADEGTPPAKVRDYVRKAVTYGASDATVEARVQYSLSDLLAESQKQDLDELPVVAGRLEEDALKAARDALRAHNLSEATRLAQSFLDVYPDSPQAREAGYIQRRAANGDKTVAGRVGVLLPMSGTYGAVGKGIREVIELANDRSGNKLSFVYEDASGDAKAVVKQLEKLVIDQGCVAIMGPLLKEQVDEVATAAQALGAPLLALSQSGTPTAAGSFIYQGFLPLEQQVDALLDFGVKERGWKSFAILHPDTAYGQSVRDLFVAGAQKRGAKVVRSIEYDDEANEFLAPARALGGKDPKARSAELYRLKAEARAKGQDDSKVVLPPQVDYDAIFIPDSFRRAALVASSLAYEEFPVGSFRPNRYAQAIPLLGLNGWNHPKMVEAGGQYVRGAIFVDAFLPDRNDVAVETFMRDYEDALRRQPGVVDALAWDATRLLQTAVVAGGPDRVAIRDELSKAVIRDPIAGGSRFGDDREVARKLLILTISGDRIRRWTPPEEPPPDGMPE